MVIIEGEPPQKNSLFYSVSDKYGPTKIIDISEYELILDRHVRWEHMYVNWAPIHVWDIYVYKNSYLRLNRSLTSYM
jgi:hypothetical protein